MNSHPLLALFLALFATPTFAFPSFLYSFSSSSASCTILTERIICTGPSITDSSLLQLKDELHHRFSGMYFLELIISSTEVTTIHASVFSEVQFETILIEDNAHLTFIDPDAFKTTPTKSLLIMNNPLLKSNEIYQLADRLEVTDYVDFDFNALVEVPSHAFNEHLPVDDYSQLSPKDTSSHKSHSSAHAPSASPITLPPINAHKKAHFKKLVISNNKIERVHTNAFHLLPSCSEIYLNYNQMAHIARHGFNLPDHGGLFLKIALDHNKLTEDSFEAEFLNLNDETTLQLNLASNGIKELKSEVFKPLLESKKILVDLSNNPLNCSSAEVAWIKENPAVLLKIRGFTC